MGRDLVSKIVFHLDYIKSQNSYDSVYARKRTKFSVVKTKKTRVDKNKKISNTCKALMERRKVFEKLWKSEIISYVKYF